jgi:hypothetical protein
LCDAITGNKDSISSSDPDISYSDKESDKDLDDNDHTTVSTTPNTIDTDIDLSQPTDEQVEHSTTHAKVLPPCVHENQIDSHEKMTLERLHYQLYLHQAMLTRKLVGIISLVT